MTWQQLMEQKIITIVHSEISVRTLTVISVKQNEQVNLSRESICYSTTTVGTVLHVGGCWLGVGLLRGVGGGWCVDWLYTQPFKMSKKIHISFLSLFFSFFF